MSRYTLLVTTAVACVLATTLLGAGGQQGAAAPRDRNQDTEMRRGAAQANQNKWNAKSPWGKTERSGPISTQKKDPFKVFDNVHYVGFQAVSAYLVQTSSGLVLIDSGFAQTSEWLLENIRKAGFDPANIRYVFVTHSHLDHAGGAARIKQAVPNARVALSAEDWAEIERQQTGPRAAEQFPLPLQRDLVLKDGEAITVGDNTFTFYVTPGHTPGATSVEFISRDGNRVHRTIIPGGLGLQYQPQWGPVFKRSIERLRQLGPWDVALGNHPFLAPKDLELIEMELKTRGNGPHPAVLGPAAVNAFFDAILAIVNEKLVAEPPPADATPPAAR